MPEIWLLTSKEIWKRVALRVMKTNIFTLLEYFSAKSKSQITTFEAEGHLPSSQVFFPIFTSCFQILVSRSSWMWRPRAIRRSWSTSKKSWGRTSELLVLTWRGANVLAQRVGERRKGCQEGRLSDSELDTHQRAWAGQFVSSGFAAHQMCDRKSLSLEL